VKTMNGYIHKIHNFVRNHTKISDTDKPFFVACVLISLKDTEFRRIVVDYAHKQHGFLYDLMENQLRKYDLDIDTFRFLRSDASNAHLHALIKMVHDIYSSNPSADLLALFYHEFVRYTNSDGKHQGIILTVEHAVELMIDLLCIGTSDTILDICCGTGSFLIEAHKRGAKGVVGCEFQKKLFELLKCNCLLRDITDYTIYNKDCFDVSFEMCTKVALNPPYGMKQKELSFVERALKFVRDGGLLVAILPRSCIESVLNANIRATILKMARLKKIIYMNKNLFAPHASVETCILLFERTRHGHDFSLDVVEVHDYTEDGIILEKHVGFKRSDEFAALRQRMLDTKRSIKISPNREWRETTGSVSDLGEFVKEHLMVKVQTEFNRKIQEVESRLCEYSLGHFENMTCAEFSITDLFEFVKGGNACIKACKTERSEIHRNYVVSASKNNNGHSGSWSDIALSKDCFTVSKNGSVGYCFYHAESIDATGDICVLKLKVEIGCSKDELASLITFNLIRKPYNYSYKLNQRRLADEKVLLPVDSCGLITRIRMPEISLTINIT